MWNYALNTSSNILEESRINSGIQKSTDSTFHRIIKTEQQVQWSAAAFFSTSSWAPLWLLDSDSRWLLFESVYGSSFSITITVYCDCQHDPISTIPFPSFSFLVTVFLAQLLQPRSSTFSENLSQELLCLSYTVSVPKLLRLYYDTMSQQKYSVLVDLFQEFRYSNYKLL